MDSAAHVRETPSPTELRPRQVIPPLRRCSRPSCVFKLFDGRRVPRVRRTPLSYGILWLTPCFLCSFARSCDRVMHPDRHAVSTVARALAVSGTQCSPSQRGHIHTARYLATPANDDKSVRVAPRPYPERSLCRISAGRRMASECAHSTSLAVRKHKMG